MPIGSDQLLEILNKLIKYIQIKVQNIIGFIYNVLNIETINVDINE